LKEKIRIVCTTGPERKKATKGFNLTLFQIPGSIQDFIFSWSDSGESMHAITFDELRPYIHRDIHKEMGER
jgi:hypothetical protein